MATSPTSSRQNSRFSSLKVFKFAAGSKPPPLPPKDPYFLPNPSLPSLNHSLSPDSFASQPVTPISAQWASLNRTPSPSPSDVPSRVTMSPGSTSSLLSPESAGFRRGLQKLSSLGKRPKTPKSPNFDLQPPEPVDDPSISLPWNFQHNVHVDEGYNGLPPTWSASLVDLGFSDDEIANINARRAAARSPSAQSIYSISTERLLASSAAVGTPYSSYYASGPNSLQRGMSEASSSQTSLRSNARSHSRSVSGSSRGPSEVSSPDAPRTELSAGDRAPRVPLPSNPRAAMPARPPPRSESSSNSGSGKDSVPRTPPRRAYHVANDSVSTISSPPPSYNMSRRDTSLSGVDEELSSPRVGTPARTDRQAEPAQPSSRVENLLRDNMASTSRPSFPLGSHMLSPPRLSLDHDALSDLTSWSESLFSSIPSTVVTPPAPAPPAPKPSTFSPLSQRPSHRRTPSQSSSRSGRHARSRSGPRNIPPQKPVPVDSLPPRTDASLIPSGSRTPPSSSNVSNPLWHEVMDLVRPRDAVSSTSDSTSSSSCAPMTPASPTAPDFGEALLVPGDCAHKENRDSDQSTMTVVPATIVRGAVARSARANVVASPSESRSDSPQSFGSHSSASTHISAVGSGSGSHSPVTTPADTRSESPKTEGLLGPRGALRRPSVVISSAPPIQSALSPASVSSAVMSPATPAPRYPGWVSEVVAPLQDFIDEATDPRELFSELQEIGEGESGSVYAVRMRGRSARVAIKNVPLLPSGTPKLVDLRRELTLMRSVHHPNILSMDTAYVDVVEDALWIRMDLMERSLADVIILVAEGLVVQEEPIAQFAADVLQALVYLQTLGIAHRDLRSDNLLLSAEGVVKLADFSSAVKVSRDQPDCREPAGVIYWQPPEMRKGLYNALKVDVWSLGATVWEMAQAEPPFSDVVDPRQLGDRWPPLYQPEEYSRSFHDFLHLCSEPSTSRPNPDELLQTPFIRSASGREAVVALLAIVAPLRSVFRGGKALALKGQFPCHS
ncbi:hypothetical protein B0H21DRAFT_810173, partial [Amylocystis lapponica]